MINLEICELLSQVCDCKMSGYRLVQISCTKLQDALEVIYSFDLDYQLIHYRIMLKIGEKIPSMSSFYPAAFLYENEIHDLFGINFTYQTIDYKGNLYQLATKTPFNPVNLVKGRENNE